MIHTICSFAITQVPLEEGIKRFLAWLTEYTQLDGTEESFVFFDAIKHRSDETGGSPVLALIYAFSMFLFLKRLIVKYL